MSNKAVPIDGRRWQVRHLTRMRKELVAHVGGAPTIPQRALIERAAQLSLQLTIMDKRSLGTGGMTVHDSAVYLAWSGHLTRTLTALGNQPAPTRARSLADHLAGRASAAA